MNKINYYNRPAKTLSKKNRWITRLKENDQVIIFLERHCKPLGIGIVVKILPTGNIIINWKKNIWEFNANGELRYNGIWLVASLKERNAMNLNKFYPELDILEE